jgi:hypothetical protein
MNTPTKYIWFCGQEANFRTRTMLIPYDLIMQCPERVKDLQVLRDHSLKNVSFKYKYKTKEYIVDQLLILNITWKGNMGKYDKTPFTEIINDFIRYADGMDEDCLCKEYDKVWANDVICNVKTKGFYHINTYCNFRNQTEYKGKPIEIVEGFLAIESTDVSIRISGINTVEELNKLYFK